MIKAKLLAAFSSLIVQICIRCPENMHFYKKDSFEPNGNNALHESKMYPQENEYHS